MKKSQEPKAPKIRKEKQPAAGSSGKPAGRRLKNKTRNMLLGYAFILPWFIGLLVFTAWPVIYSMYLSLCKVAVTTGGIDAQFMGFVNYFEAFRGDVNWSGLLVNQTLYVLMCTPLIIVFSVIMALLLNQKVRGRLFFRALYFFPVIIISGPVMKELLTNNASSVITAEGNTFYQIFSQIPYIGDVIIFAFSQLVLILWYSGVQVLIFLAGLQKIDKSMYEAARIDGGLWLGDLLEADDRPAQTHGADQRNFHHRAADRVYGQRCQYLHQFADVRENREDLFIFIGAGLVQLHRGAADYRIGLPGSAE